MRDVIRIEGGNLAAWLRHKIDDGGIAKGTFRQYAAALGRFTGAKVDFSPDLAEARQYASTVLTSDRSDRAFDNPGAVLACLPEAHSRLTAKIQLESGARFDEVRQIRSERLVEGGVLVSGKGGYERVLALSPQTLGELNDHLASNFGRYILNYDEYLKDIKAACEAVGEVYSGSHSFRHNYARQSFAEHLAEGKTYNEALKCVAAELGHHRASITKAYL